MSDSISPNTLAKRTGLGRSSVMRAINSGRLQAFRDNQGRWQIPESEAARFETDRPDTMLGDNRAPQADTPTDTPETLEKLASAEVERDQLRERLTEVQADRDHWRGMAEKLAERPRSWWPFGRSK